MVYIYMYGIHIYRYKSIIIDIHVIINVDIK